MVFLEDRRVLYNPMDLEVRSQVDHSIHEIRHQCTDLLRTVGEKAFAVVPIRAIREACRRFHDDESMDFRFFDRLDHHGVGVGFFVALGAFRATVGSKWLCWPLIMISASKVTSLLCCRAEIQIRDDIPLCEPSQHFVERGGHPNDSTTVQEHSRLVLRLIVVADHGHRVLAHCVADAIDAGDEDEAGDPLPLNGLVSHGPCLCFALGT
jgi:hypothetical protein